MFLKKRGNIIRKIDEMITTRASLTAFLYRMKLKGNIENYKIWYYEECATEFDENKFHEKTYSKLICDFHDGVVAVNSVPF